MAKKAKKISFGDALASFENISTDVVLSALKEAFANAVQKEKGKGSIVKVDINEKNGKITIVHQLNIVNEVVDPILEISLSDAQNINPDYKVGDVLETSINPDDFSRVAAIHVKQVLRQKVTEAEKQMVYDAYIGKKDEIVSGQIERVEADNKFVLVNLGKTNALMRGNQTIPGEKYVVGEMIKVYIQSVDKEAKGAPVLISRADPNFLKRLLEDEITEIYDGTVIIKNIVREAGERAKVAVFSHDPNVDPTGSCIGLKGMRIQKVTSEINNEKIDVVQYYDDPTLYIAEALKPSNVLGIVIDEANHSAIAIVPNEELSLAIGKKGQNARLAVKLTGWKIDIKTVDNAMNEHIVYTPISQLRKALNPVEEVPTNNVEEVYSGPEFETPIEKVKTETKKKAKPVNETYKTPKDLEISIPSMPHISVVEEEVKEEKKEEVPLGPSKKSIKKAQQEKEKLAATPSTVLPVYSDEELAEIEKEEQAAEQEEASKYDEEIDYDEYDEYYDDED